MSATTINVVTRCGIGGRVIGVATFNVGPLNLLKAVRLAREERKKNRGVGGYATFIKIGGLVLPDWECPWPGTLAEARAAIDEIEVYKRVCFTGSIRSETEGVNMGAFEVRAYGVYVDGALIDREFMESGDYWLQCDSVAQAAKVRGFIVAASLV
jgi:hypothetical protein